MLSTLMLAATLCAGGRSDYAIVAGGKPNERIAANELQTIFAQSTGVTLPIVDGAAAKGLAPRLAPPSGSQARGGYALPEGAKHVLFVGYTAEAEKAFGKDDLKANEYALTEKTGFLGFGGGDLWLRGTSHDGTMLAVYRFCEDTLGYRCFVSEPGCERIVKQTTVKTDGKGFRHVEAFPSGRSLTHSYLYGDLPNLTKFIFRNGSFCKSGWLKNTPYAGYEGDIVYKDSGHGFHLYLPCKRHGMEMYEWDEDIDFFKVHPEWFSMNSIGTRTDGMQLCFSNKELRKAFTKRVLERCRRVGGKGVLTVGANDVPGAFCWCPECKALQKKYETPSGAYWDYLPELCNAVAAEYPKIRIMTLAYRKEQSENFPKGVEKFPDNFICDFAPVDDNQSFLIGGKGNEKSLDNLKKWCRACKTVGYWYYAVTPHPYGLVSRPTGDIRTVHAAGTDETKLCGMYAAGFGPLLDYLFLRLALDPAQDPWARVKEFCDGMYGAASEDVQQLVRELDRVWFRPTPFVGIDVDATSLKCYRGDELVRWQKLLDAAERKIAGDAHAQRWLSLVRWDVDMLTLQFWRDIRNLPGLPEGLTPAIVYARMKKVVHLKRSRSTPETATKAATGLYDKAKNAYLVALALDRPIPAPLDKLPAEQVIQIPQCGGCHGVADPEAACGFAKSEIFPTNLTAEVYAKRLVGCCYYDTNRKRTMRYTKIDFSKCTPGKYEMYDLGKVKIVPGALITFASWWGIGQNLSNYYPEGDADREFGLWASLKLVGPQFGVPTADGRNRMYCDRIFLVDTNGKKYKGE